MGSGSPEEVKIAGQNHRPFPGGPDPVGGAAGDQADLPGPHLPAYGSRHNLGFSLFGGKKPLVVGNAYPFSIG